MQNNPSIKLKNLY